ncbi:Lrp/AsnC family transcriptional regulator [Gorillibacterium sp. CAU 1737]|uniref:Lrp/AsnC family transcriptional regulator n=1 Tax=Gorillibacterium sp. CAU 1737 TaxID=3140362 RepID=UPI0032600D56
MSSSLVDDTDRLILKHLIQDASLSHKELGQLVHMTGQAVGIRVRRLEDLGILEGRTLRWNAEKLGLSVHAFVTVFLRSPDGFSRIQAFLNEREEVEEAHRVSGEGCYWMRVRTADLAQLNELLEPLTSFATYKLTLSIGRVKG